MLPCCCSLWMQKFSPLFGIQMKKLIPNNIFTYHVKNVVKSCTESVYLRVFIVHYFLAWWRKKLFFFLLSLSLAHWLYTANMHTDRKLSQRVIMFVVFHGKQEKENRISLSWVHICWTKHHHHHPIRKKRRNSLFIWCYFVGAVVVVIIVVWKVVLLLLNQWQRFIYDS